MATLDKWYKFLRVETQNAFFVVIFEMCKHVNDLMGDRTWDVDSIHELLQPKILPMENF